MKNKIQNSRKKIIAIFMIFIILSSYLPSFNGIVQAVSDTTGISSDTTGEIIDEDVEINITDEKLKEYFLLNHDYDGNGKITKSDMEKVEYFSYSSYDENHIVDLDVIKYCTNLTQFYIYGKYFININVIKEFKNLQSISLSYIEDISIIEELPNLRYLSLENIDLTNVNWDNISKNLTDIKLMSCNLENIYFITKFENLQFVNLQFNNIKDLSPLKQLKKLVSANLDFSEENADIIEELSINNLWCTQSIYLKDIKVEKGKILEIDLPLICQKVIDKNSKLYSENISYFNNNSNGNVRIKDDNSKIIVDATNLDVTENKYENLNLNADHANANININYSVYEPVDEKKEIEITDKYLKKLLLENYDYDSDGIITDFDMLQITNLTLNNSDIKKLNGLEYAKNIKLLNIYNLQKDVDISIIKKLDKLEKLYLSYTNITDLSYLKELKNLNSLQININTYEDNLIDFVSINELSQLKTLIIYDNAYFQEIDINKISNLTNLTNLILTGKISNIDLIGTKFTNLSELRLTTKNILENIEFVGKLTNLETLELTDNNINDISPLKGLEKLKWVYLTKNPINTKELNNAETLQILRDRGVFVSIIETNSTTNLDFKDIEFKNALIADGKDLNKDNEISIAEMENINYLSINNVTIESIEEIEYAKNLYSLNLNDTNIKDLTPILKLKNFNNMSISGNLDSKDIESIAKIKNLTNLSISHTEYDGEGLDITGIENLTNLTNLQLLGNINLQNCESISSLIKLNTLGLSIHKNGLVEILDLKGIDKLTNLSNLNLSVSFKNIELLKKLENLTNIQIYGTVYNLDGDRIRMPSDDVMILLNELKIETTRFSCYNEYINLGNFLQGITKEINLKELDIIKHIYDENSIFYDPNVNIHINYGDSITINDEQKIIINTKDLGNNYASININSEKVNTSINFTWRNYIEGDKQKEINIPDINLKNRILENDDIDEDGKITEHDMINLVDLYLDSMTREDKIKNLEGLQYAINLISIDLLWNNVSDLTPILNLEKVEYVNLDGNLITDTKFLNNAKWSDEFYSIYLPNNFIDFNNSENYSALKNFYENKVNDESYMMHDINYSVNRQRYGNVNEIDNVVELEENLKNKLIEIGVDENADNKITRRELYYLDSYYYNFGMGELDLSDSNLTDISGLEYVGNEIINLSKNNISDITSLTKNTLLYEINLSDNNISNINGIEKINNLTTIKLAHNNIENIEPLSNLKILKSDGYRDVTIDLSNNKISDITCVKNWKNLYNLDLSNNIITDISSLKDYNFKVEGENEYAEILKIDLSGNDINMTNAGNKAAKEVFDSKGAKLKLIDTSKAKLYVLDKNGVFTSESNLGSINTEISWDSEYEFVSEKNRKYYPEGSDVNLAGIFLNSVYYDSPEHNLELDQKGFDEEIVVTGAIKTENSFGGSKYLIAELTVPEGYIGNTAQIGTLDNAEIISRTRNTITLKMFLNSDSTDMNYFSFNASILLKEKEQVLDDITNKEEIIEHIKGEHDVTLDMTTDIAEVSNEVFETLAEKEDVKFKVETENAVWSFSSDNIENTEITLNPKVQISDSRFEDMSNSGVEDGIFIKFEHEGVLPGKAEIELDVSDCNKYEDGKTIYLYYFDSEKNQYRYISSTRSENNIVKITLEHCSEYVLTEEMLYTIGDVNQDGKITLADYTKILAHVKKTQLLKDHALLAADVNGDGKVTLADYTKVLAHVKKTQLLY